MSSLPILVIYTATSAAIKEAADMLEADGKAAQEEIMKEWADRMTRMNAAIKGVK